MLLARDLWRTSPLRAAAVVALILVGAVGTAGAGALAGPLLVDRSVPVFVLLALAMLAIVVTDLVVGLVAAGLCADWSAQVRRRLCAVAFAQDLPTLEGTPVGELLDRIDNDVYQVAAEVRNAGVRIAQSVSAALLSVLAALLLWWPAGVGMLLLTALLVAGLWRRTARIAVARTSEEEAWSDLAAVMEESIHGQDDVRTSLARPYALGLYADRASQVLHRGRQVWRLSAQVSVVASAAMRAGLVAVVVGGAWLLSEGRLDPARLTSVWLLLTAFVATADHVGRLVPELQQALGAWARIRMLAASPQEPVGGLPPADGDLVVHGLTFAYPTERARRRPALRDVHVTFHRGRSTALLGRTGSGKSTLAKVLTRSVDVPRGTVSLGDVDLVDCDLEALRRWIAVVPQRTEILAGTLAENVALFDPDLLGPARLALTELGLDEWVADLPEGFDTRLGDGGHALSAGQEQLVAFARILVRDPHVVILDEATARMDPVTESRVRRATERLLDGRIGIVIAHRLSSVQHCDDVVVLTDGEVLEAGPLHASERFAALLETSRASASDPVTGGMSVVPAGPHVALEPEPLDVAVPPGEPRTSETASPTAASASKASPSTGSAAASAVGGGRPDIRTMRELLRLVTNDPRWGLSSLGLFLLMILFGLEGSVLPWLWADLVGGDDVLWPAVGIVAGLLVVLPAPYYTGKWFPEWWVRQELRIGLRLVDGQTAARRRTQHTPAEVVAQGGDTERVVELADNLVDQFVCIFVLVSMTVVARSAVPAAFFAATLVLSAAVAFAFGTRLAGSAQRTVDARSAFVTALVSSLSSARTVKLSGATRPVLAHLARLDRVRSDRQRREIVVQVWARSTPAIAAGLLPIGVWALYLGGRLSAGATLVAVSILASANWLAWTTASLVSHLPSAKVWTRRTVAMSGAGAYSTALPGVDLGAGTAPGPVPAPRSPLQRLELRGFGAVHEDGSLGARGVDLGVRRGQLVLLVGPVGSGKSSLLRALAGIVDHTGQLRWNGEPVTQPESFLRPNQVAYVAQLPRVLSGTVGDNIRLGHAVDAAGAVTTAQLDADLAGAGGGLGLLIGHKGTQLSGGQLQRLALARALAPRTELLIADDVSSALDVATELDLWRALRRDGVTVIGSTSKRAALVQADLVLVMIGGRAVDRGTWPELEPRWSHLAG